MRPPGEIRVVLAEATRELLSAGNRSGVTWREAAEHASVGYTAARRTMENMVRDGKLQRLAERHVAPDTGRPMTLFAPVAAPAAADDDVPPLMVLDDVMRGWLDDAGGLMAALDTLD
jgi:hypothetical protein